MAKNLIIVESPAKTRTLKKFLGKGWDVQASLGHIRDLEKKNLGLGDNYEPRYMVLPAKEEVVSKLKKAAKKADTIYLAPDPDREGEAIAWHIQEVLGEDAKNVHRVTFNEITKNAVLSALENAGSIDARLVDAQQARRVLDRLMGFKLSPLLWEKVKRGLSAGRVQSVALKMVCDRQAAIDAFVAVEYWHIDAELEGAEPPVFKARLSKIGGKKAKVENAKQAETIVDALKAGSFVVDTVQRKESKKRPTPPFITSRLQQEAARRFSFPVKRTMGIAQGLYEGKEIGELGSIGLITYMRTDSTRVSDEAITAVREHIAERYGKDEVPAKPNVFKSKKGAQDAHEAIRPTSLELPPEKVAAYLQPEDLKLYRLIWERFVASQMLPAIYDVTQVDIANGASGNYTLRANGRIMKRPGFLAVYQETLGRDAAVDDSEGVQLPKLAEGETLKLHQMLSEQKFTQPPAQYSEATLIKALEENGIGRPSTYASILSTLSVRDYVTKAERRFRPTALGTMVNQLLQDGFNDIINEGYTAALEEQLDEIEEGKLDWKKALAKFDRKFSKDLSLADKQMPNVKRDGVPLEEECPDCGKGLVMRFGRYGSFIGCTTYPECKYTRDAEGEPSNGDTDGEAKEPPTCDQCGKPMALKRSRFGTFFGCTGYPECRNIVKTGAQQAPPKPTGVSCPDCKEGDIVEKKSRRGRIFYSCNRYPDCKYALWNKPIPKACPTCSAPFVVEKFTKKKGTQHLCHSEDCDFEEIVEAPG